MLQNLSDPTNDLILPRHKFQYGVVFGLAWPGYSKRSPHGVERNAGMPIRTVDAGNEAGERGSSPGLRFASSVGVDGPAASCAKVRCQVNRSRP